MTATGLFTLPGLLVRVFSCVLLSSKPFLGPFVNLWVLSVFGTWLLIVCVVEYEVWVLGFGRRKEKEKEKRYAFS